MDPLSAVSLAGTVVAFVDFSLKLASRATEICGSENGSSDKEASLETVYATLSKCSANLSTAVGGQTTTGSSQLPRSYACIRELAHACQIDCAAMLRMLERLKEARKFEPGDSSIERRAKSLRGALKAVFRDPELKSLESRLQRTQRALTLELCAISRTSADYQTHHTNQLEKVRLILDNLQLPGGNFHHDDVLVLEQHMSKFSIATHDIAYQQDIIKGLEFESFHFRQHDIQENHEETYHWALRKENRQAKCQERLERWFSTPTNAGVFWVSGKPGSGKSTFMKYVVHSNETMDKLDCWAQGHQVIIASHYLWARGSPMQRSLQGLLRTLLLDIFRQCPHLISQLLDGNASTLPRTDVAKRIDWSIPRLRSTIGSLVSGKAPGVRFCIFVDGLDEFDGDHLDLSQYLLRLSESPLVKLCVSSRPWNVFEDAFGNNPSFKLYMHDLNHGDILAYTRSRLFEHPRWKLLPVQHADACNLVDEITRRSTGVFLWVFLVTRMLREGLTNDDSFAGLCNRLLTFPSDLHSFFRNIIESVDPIYQERTSGCLQLARNAIEPLETLIYYFHDVQYDNHAHAPHQYTEYGVLDTNYKNSIEKYTVRRINAYCRGLLERRKGKIEFLHRTVADFLDTGEMVRLLAEKSRAKFDPLLSILDCFASLLETQRRLHNWFIEYLKLAMAYVSLVENRNDGSSAMAYLLLDKIVGYLPLSTFLGYGKPDFIKLAMETHLLGYIHCHLQKDPGYCDCLDPDVINVALSLPDSSSKESLLDMVFRHEQSRDSADSLLPSRVTKSWATYISMVSPLDLVIALTRSRQAAAHPQHFSNGLDARTIYSTAWMSLLFIVFQFPLYKTSERSFLGILDLLIDYGAHFPEDPMRNEVHILFFYALQGRRFDRSNGESTSSEQEFIAKVMMRLMRKVNWDMTQFWPAIERFLGAGLLGTIRATYIAAANNREQPFSMVKASQSRSTSPGTTGRKRRRLTGIDPRQGQQKRLLMTQSVQDYCVISDSDDDDGRRKPAIKVLGESIAEYLVVEFRGNEVFLLLIIALDVIQYAVRSFPVGPGTAEAEKAG
ncbi:hypothetical protein PG996_006451 [Apiospora saccharicola]|uniref:NACHT domain-containing protein n=1 Tax=Apiospora saccharicola TaxID=335842 RepID=A0ABR1VPH1_9PEZI